MNTTGRSIIATDADLIRPTGTSIPKNAAIIVLAAGILIRLYFFFLNRGLWGDDSFLALNLIERNFQDLASPPLDYGQQAPLLFLWTEKLFVSLLGPSEMSMRLFPLVCGIAALLIFYRLANKVLVSPVAVFVSVALLSFSPPVIRYSVDIKQYETELLTTLLVLLSYFNFKNQISTGWMVIWGVIGGLLSLFSYPAIFLLVTIAMYLAIQKLYFRKWREMLLLSVAFGIWASAFLLNYYLFISVGVKDNTLLEYWDGKNSFAPLPPLNVKDFLWYPQRVSKIFENPLSISWEGVNWPSKIRFSITGLLFLTVGLISLWFDQKKSPAKDLSLIFLILISILLVVSGAGKYPFQGRFLLFIVPFFFIFIGSGAGILFQRAYRTLVFIPVIVTILILLAAPLFNIISKILAPKIYAANWDYGNKIREGILFIEKYRKADEPVYIHSCTKSVYKSYNHIYNMSWIAIEGINAWGQATNLDEYKDLYRSDLSQFRNRSRVWVLLGSYPIKFKGEDYKKHFHKPEIEKIKESVLIKKVLDEMGIIQQQFHGKDVDVYLYDFSKGATRSN